MNIKKSYEIALKFAYQAGAEFIANPGHEDCGIGAAREGFAFYCEAQKFSDLPEEKQQAFYAEWQKGKDAERKACGL
jgi:hypothetical protein